MDFRNVSKVTIPEGNVVKISVGGVKIWSSGPGPTPTETPLFQYAYTNTYDPMVTRTDGYADYLEVFDSGSGSSNWINAGGTITDYVTGETITVESGSSTNKREISKVSSSTFYQFNQNVDRVIIQATVRSGKGYGTLLYTQIDGTIIEEIELADNKVTVIELLNVEGGNKIVRGSMTIETAVISITGWNNSEPTQNWITAWEGSQNIFNFSSDNGGWITSGISDITLYNALNNSDNKRIRISINLAYSQATGSTLTPKLWLYLAGSNSSNKGYVYRYSGKNSGDQVIEFDWDGSNVDIFNLRLASTDGPNASWYNYGISGWNDEATESATNVNIEVTKVEVLR